MIQVVENLKNLYSTFDRDSIENIAAVYTDDVVFEDPIHRVEGISELRRYFLGSVEGLTSCHFDFDSTLVENRSALLTWVMRYEHRSLAGGRALSLSGCSHIRANGDDSRICFHRDYYDMGEMVYQHVPILGWAVNKINDRIAG